MKKFFILALFVLGMYNASTFAMTQEIILNELYFVMPLDDAKEETLGGRPDPNQIRATIDGTRMRVNAHIGSSVYVEVINQSTGEVVVEEEFVEETEAIIPQAGLYFIQVYTGNSVVGGEFEVE